MTASDMIPEPPKTWSVIGEREGESTLMDSEHSGAYPALLQPSDRVVIYISNHM